MDSFSILAWNCYKGGFQIKSKHFRQNLPDIAVISECEDLPFNHWQKIMPEVSSFLWTGLDEYRDQGLGVFGFSGWHLEKHPDHDDSIHFVLPVIATKGNFRILVMACWPNVLRSKGNYVERLILAEERYKHLFANEEVLWAGDFNLTLKGPSGGSVARRGQFFRKLQEHGHSSCYHSSFNEVIGNEEAPTYFHKSTNDAPFHIDYIFASSSLHSRLTSFELGKKEQWLSISDHVPLRATFSLNRQKAPV